MKYEEALTFIQSFPDMERATFGARGPSMGLPSMKSLLARMGNPQAVAKTIHVTGSKGKGSTAFFINAILVEAGYRTAMFASPHLHHYCERYVFGSEAISPVEFACAIGEIKPMVEAEQAAGNDTIATFGILAAAFFHMVATAKQKIDWQIVEVGVGGRYDVTNVFESKAAAVITPISLEHVEFLGKTQTEIAANKAGIITSQCLAVLAQQKDGGARTAVGRRCHEVDAELVDVAKRYKHKIISQDCNAQTFSLEGNGFAQELQIKALGAHQINNAITAVATILALRGRDELTVTDEQIKSGLAKAFLAGRMEILQSAGSGKPLVVADGAHNHESAQALAACLKTTFGARQCIFVLGVNNDKNISAIWKELGGLSKFLVTTKSLNPRSMNPEHIAELLSVFEEENPQVVVSQSVAEALEKALAMAKEDDLVCVTGSLYVVAEARNYFFGEQRASETALNFLPCQKV
jgi:dihydrofolate synthase/folylpolyglutamate synthase